ncbi:MAG: ABC-F family ATP-binding cassette domain-containing protein [Saprospiraceae bacterium]
MYYFRDIQKQYSDRKLLNGISFMIGKRERIGLVGRNGAGKSTLIKIIAGEMSSDGGSIEIPSGTTIGYLKQEFNYKKGISVLEETLGCFKEIKEIHREIDEVTEELTHRDDYESDSYADLAQKLADLTTKLGLLDEGTIEARASRILTGLGFKEADFSKDIHTFSGGWQMRVELAKLLLTTPDILLLDEPNNHLDIESIIWLENYLKEYPGIVIIISHDTMFLNNLCERIIEIELGNLYDYKGNYNKYKIDKASQKEILQASYANQQKVIEQKEKTINRFMAKATKTKMAQSMQKQLNKIERIEIPDEDTSLMNIQFAPVKRSGRDVLDITGITKSYDEKLVLSPINLKVERGDRIAFVGQNGQGKSTLAKIITGAIDASGGDLKLGTNVDIGYYAQDQTEKLNPNERVLDVALAAAPEEMRTKARSVLGSFLFTGEDSDKYVSVLSGGERARLAFACMVMNHANLLVFDEPTNHLDIQAKFILKDALMKYEGTLIVVSHDRDFLRGLTNKVYEFKDHTIKEYLGDVDYFLEKRKLEDMRSVEISTAKNKTSQPVPTPEISLSFEEQKQIKRKIQSIEKDIESLENKISTIQNKMNDPDYYNSDQYTEDAKSLSEFKTQLSAKEQEWETLVESAGNAL